MPSPGELLGARYRLDDRIAAGGMGEVWRATDTVLERPVAVKTLLAGFAGDVGFRTRFHHEARAMAALRHAGVAPVYDFGDTGEGAFLVMARVDGLPLDRWIAERGPLSPHQTMSIVAQAARALGTAHEAGIVHRDVKPGNLIIEPDGNVVLVDFGVARSAHSADLTGAKEVVGTALYIAPEQVAKRTTGPSADQYALGIVAYHCLAGRPPFIGDNPLAVALQHLDSEPPPLPASVPAPVRDLIATALAKDPAARFPSAFAMAEAADTAAAQTRDTNTNTNGLGAAGTPGNVAAADQVGITKTAIAPFIGSAAAPPARPHPAFATETDIGSDTGSGIGSTTGDGTEGGIAGGGIAGGGIAGGGIAGGGIAGGGIAGGGIGSSTTSPANSPPVSDTTRWTPTTIPAPPANPRPRPQKALIALAAGLLTLLGIGAVFAFADPFGYFDEPGSSTPAPAVSVPERSAAPAKKGNSGKGNTTTKPTKKDESRAPADEDDDQEEATRPAATSPAATATATRTPEETTTTTDAPEEEPTTTTAPETPAQPEPTE
ncbi:serine/threonine-protein kinase [Actinoplanes sp. GCM10030250]|uniref:serine/threonine-protein kinase n=1 Tax=Actinoplanes sp. GCM10030250 TaxID=3273376 RepID=UPI00362044B1